MGAVHCVRDKNLLREVAIKVLAPSLADDPSTCGAFSPRRRIQRNSLIPTSRPVHDLTMDHEGTNTFTHAPGCTAGLG